jgi:hypothetical protein
MMYLYEHFLFVRLLVLGGYARKQLKVHPANTCSLVPVLCFCQAVDDAALECTCVTAASSADWCQQPEMECVLRGAGAVCQQTWSDACEYGYIRYHRIETLACSVHQMGATLAETVWLTQNYAIVR